VFTARTLVPLWNRQAEWDSRMRMVREAREFLYLSTYYVEHDRFSTELLSALTDAQRRGVCVNLLIDDFGQRLGGTLMSSAHREALNAGFDALRREGGRVTLYRPPRLVQRRLGGGQHVKIQVSEAGEAIFGSSNITRSSFQQWNEYSVALTGPIVWRLLESYAEIGGVVAGAHAARLRDAPSGDLELEYWICNPNAHQGRWGPLGWRGHNAVTDRLVRLIDSAQRSIAVTSFYFKPVEALIAALIRARSRGVSVEVHHSHRDALLATDLAWIAAASTYDRLLGAGVRIWENRHGEHSKIVLVDEASVAFGSYNLEDAAHDRLAEAMLVSSDPRAVGPAIAIFAELRASPQNIPVTSELMAALPRRLRLRRALYGRFKRWM
jgi:cardiolipin synthase